jgi:hypothetical protein
MAPDTSSATSLRPERPKQSFEMAESRGHLPRELAACRASSSHPTMDPFAPAPPRWLPVQNWSSYLLPSLEAFQTEMDGLEFEAAPTGRSQPPIATRLAPGDTARHVTLVW